LFPVPIIVGSGGYDVLEVMQNYRRNFYSRCSRVISIVLEVM
jgi:hypothetical protein